MIASFHSVDESATAAKSTMILNYNGTRCAFPRASLGFVQPKFLFRGISLSSIKESKCYFVHLVKTLLLSLVFLDGGAIYGMRLKIIRVLPPWTKCSVMKYSDEVESAMSVFCNTILSRWEHEWIMDQVEKLHDQYVYSKSSSEDYENSPYKLLRKNVCLNTIITLIYSSSDNLCNSCFSFRI